MRTSPFALCVLAAAATAHAQCIVMGGFDAARGGLLSLAEGGWLTQLRAAIATEFPSAVELSGSGQMTETYLGGVDVLVLASVWDGGTPVSPLTLQEQEAVRAFVLHGGSAIILVDNEGFELANESLADPFGLDVTGTTMYSEPVTVPNPLGHPITGGRFGVVPSFTILLGGWFDSLGAHASPLGYLGSGFPALAVISPGAIGPGSGPVVLFSDASIFFDLTGHFQEHRTIILNAVAFALGEIRRPCYPDCDRLPGCLPPVLDIFDFLCFQNRFAAQDPYACDCDAAQGLGICDVFDFLCFQNRFAFGCP